MEFALQNPHAYRIMFDIDVPIDATHPELRRRPRAPAVTSPGRPNSLSLPGVISVDPTLFGWSMWAAMHGLVMLHQSGMLAHGPDYRQLSHFHDALMADGAAAARKKTKKAK